MKRGPQVSLLWKLYLEIVHNILVFEILRHELPHGFVSFFKAVLKMAEQNGSALAIVLAILVSVGRILWSARTAETPKEQPKEEPKPKPPRKQGSSHRPKAN